MRLPVTLANHTSLWQMDDSARLDAWIRGGRWVDEGGLQLLRLPSGQDFFAATDYLEGQLIASAFRSDPVIHRINVPDPFDAETTLFKQIYFRLGVTGDQSEFQKLLGAAGAIDGRPTAIVLDIQPSHAHQAIQYCGEFIDSVEKVGGLRRPTIIGLVREEPPPLTKLSSLLRGAPDEIRLCDLELDTHECWRRYLHQRLAWESGGYVECAQRWCQKTMSDQIPMGDDDRLEAELNLVAVNHFAALHPEQLSDLERFITRYLSEKSTFDTSLVSKLEDAQLVFRRGIHHQIFLCPWVSRAWILSKHVGHQSDQLRSLLCCLPLGKELLSHCFLMEARERTLCYAEMQDEAVAKKDTKDDFIEYQTRGAKSVFHFYPRQSPAAVTHIWQFASFGEVLGSTKVAMDRSRKDHQHSLRRLRNALAHGHYPSWRMLAKVRSLMRALA